ncbi:MAG: NAAT family transporter [Rhodospirillales bacterium]|nr:NAAT family transporter [Rhodospirillales bacterium]
MFIEARVRPAAALRSAAAGVIRRSPANSLTRNSAIPFRQRPASRRFSFGANPARRRHILRFYPGRSPRPASRAAACRWPAATRGAKRDGVSQAVDLFLYALVALAVIVDPAGTAVMFIGLTPQDTPAERASQARRACLVAFVVLALFGLGGDLLLSRLGISLAAMKVAGGILLFLTAADMVTAKGAMRATSAERQAAIRTPDIAVFPLAIPYIAGPGAMTTMVVLHARAAGHALAVGAVELALAIVVGATLLALLLARGLARVLGETGASVIGRVLGVLLAGFAAQMVLDGLRQGWLH